MNLKELNDDRLAQNLLTAVRQERKLTSQILDLLREVEDRKLFAKRGYPSLFAYCTEHLGYSESAAQRRISSMRLLREVPQVKERVQSGTLSLSNVSQAARFFRQEKKIKSRTYEPHEKAEILEGLTGKTQKEAEKQLIKISPEPFKKVDSERSITEDLTEMRFTLNKETLAKLNRLRELKPHMTTPELLDWLLSRTLKQMDPLAKPEKKVSSHKNRISSHQKKTSPSEKEISSYEKKISLPEKKTSSHEKRTSLSEKEISSHEKKISLSKKKTSSHEKKTSLPEKETSSNGKKTSSHEKKASLTKKKILSDTQTKLAHSSLPKRHQNKPIKPEPLRRPLTKKTKSQVWQRANGCCQFKDHKTGKLCGSRKGLEVDHIRPLSLGGDDAVSNLRLLCKEHHRLLTRMSFP